MTEGFTPGMPLKDVEELAQQIFAALRVDKESDPLAAARALPWEEVVAAQASKPLDAAVDGWFLADTVASVFRAGRQNAVPFITVANLGEITGPGIAALLFPTLIPGYTNMLTNAGKAGVEGYAAVFEHMPANWKADGAVPPHVMEIPYVFGDMDPMSAQWATMGVSKVRQQSHSTDGSTQGPGR